MSTTTPAQLASIRRAIQQQIAFLAAKIDAVNDKTQRAGGTLNYASSGSQTLDVAWPKPFKDTAYGIWITLISATPAQVHCTYAPATKSTTGVTVTVVAASAVGDVVVDVLAART